MLRCHRFAIVLHGSLIGGLLLTSACPKSEPASQADSSQEAPPPEQSQGPTVEDARRFVRDVDGKLRKLWTAESRADWNKATNITDATEEAAAQATAAVMGYESQAIKDAAQFKSLTGLPPAVKRQLELLTQASTLPAPEDPTKRQRLADLGAKLESMYGTGKYCSDDGKCRDLQELSRVMATSRNPAELRDAWTQWRTVSVPMRPLYQELVELANEGARSLGFADVGELWRSRYDMTPQAFEQEIERLWQQVAPLYEQLHCHVRARLQATHGDAVPDAGPIPAHLLGNMWAQEWHEIYPLVEPYPKEASLDVTKALKKKNYDATKMVKLAESFFTSLGMKALPETFWERSMFVKPQGREVVCHASAWDVDMNNDLRIKMCIEPNHEDLVTIHHELGHNYYYTNYYTLPVLFQSGAHDGFHEAIGDAIALSITPEYLKKVGLLDEISSNERGVINKQMQDALQKIAFLPFGLLVDKWRWDVFSGKTKPDQYNAAWWALREDVQGVSAPVERTEEHFDPGAKYHVPANVPYARYFLARILQFQFHKALCEAAGFTGPLHECSIYGSEDAGKKLKAMLAMGASQPWPEALEALTGTREMDARPMLEYFEPLTEFLAEQNRGRRCGWKSDAPRATDPKAKTPAEPTSDKPTEEK